MSPHGLGFGRPWASRLAIHRRVFTRLVIAWVAISIMLGGAVFWLETRRIDEQALALALDESAQLAVEPATFGSRTPEALRALQQSSEELVRRHFLVVELYDRDKGMLLQTIRPGHWETEAALSRFIHGFPEQGRLVYHTYYLEGQMLVQVLVPLTDVRGVPFGYFEGVYQVDREGLRHLRQDLVRVPLLVVAVIAITTALLYPIILALNRGLTRLAHDLLESNVELMTALGAAIAQRDAGTNMHNYRVTLYAIAFARSLKLGREQLRNLIAGAFLHDVGKIGISDAILHTPGHLTAHETEAMRSHVPRGLEIISQAHWLQAARDVVAAHHETYDGTGYPAGLKGEAIPLNARIFAIVDTFDALTSVRPYKPAWSLEQAMDVLREGSGSRFDPRLVETLRASRRGSTAKSMRPTRRP